MMPPKTLLDTDVLSAILKRRPVAIQRTRQYLASHSQLSFSLITRFEVLRGLQARKATTQIAAFEILCNNSEVMPIDERVIVLASTIDAELHQMGKLILDADLLIAATALKHGLVLATNNVSHFSRIPGLTIDNWLA